MVFDLSSLKLQSFVDHVCWLKCYGGPKWGYNSILKIFASRHSFKFIHLTVHKFIKILEYEDELSKEIIEAGEILLSYLYNGKGTEDLDKLRYNMFCEKLATSKCQVELHMLLPFSDVAKYHSLRVFHQIREWKGNGEDIDPLLWEWTVMKGRLMPKFYGLDVHPPDLLITIRCNCKSGCVNLRCSCKRHGLPCSTACGECRGYAKQIQQN